MIKNIFIDYDECIIHSTIYPPDQNCLSFALDGDFQTYYTIIRPCAKTLIEFSRQLVGPENVFILTTSTRDYAEKINELALFGFKNDQILAREDIKAHYFTTAYGGSTMVPHQLADPNNVLIDNLPPKYNENKIALIGISQNYKEKYFNCADYYGVNFPDDPFEQDVKDFLIKNHNTNEH